jgi:hypothetical protein
MRILVRFDPTQSTKVFRLFREFTSFGAKSNFTRKEIATTKILSCNGIHARCLELVEKSKDGGSLRASDVQKLVPLLQVSDAMGVYASERKGGCALTRVSAQQRRMPPCE